MSEHPVHLLTQAADRAGLKYLLIGGYAVVAYGSQRVTADVDFLIRDRLKPAWQKFLEARGYRVHHEESGFLQFNGHRGMAPVDLMLVEEGTWEKMEAASQRRAIGGRAVPMVAPLHLIALKLHAIRQNPRREAQDRMDIDGLIREQKIDVHGAESGRSYCAIPEKSPMPDSPKTIQGADGSRSADYGDLILPIPSPDLPLRPAAMDPEAFDRLLWSVAEEMATRPGFEEWRLERKANFKRFEM